MLIEKPIRYRLICFGDFVGMTLLAVSFMLPLLNWFPRVSLTTILAAVLKFFPLLTTSTISGAISHTKSASTRFATATIYLRKNGIALLLKLCATSPNPRPRWRPKPL